MIMIMIIMIMIIISFAIWRVAFSVSITKNMKEQNIKTTEKRETMYPTSKTHED